MDWRVLRDHFGGRRTGQQRDSVAGRRVQRRSVGGHAGWTESDSRKSPSRSGIDTFTSADGLPDDFIRSLLIDADGSLWIGTRRGLTHWARGRDELSDTRSSAGMETYTQANGLGSDLVGAMARDTKGDLVGGNIGRAIALARRRNLQLHSTPEMDFRAMW